jgi:hypothetical protein
MNEATVEYTSDTLFAMLLATGSIIGGQRMEMKD